MYVNVCMSVCVCVCVGGGYVCVCVVLCERVCERECVCSLGFDLKARCHHVDALFVTDLYVCKCIHECVWRGRVSVCVCVCERERVCVHVRWNLI